MNKHLTDALAAVQLSLPDSPDFPGHKMIPPEHKADHDALNKHQGLLDEAHDEWHRALAAYEAGDHKKALAHAANITKHLEAASKAHGKMHEYDQARAASHANICGNCES